MFEQLKKRFASILPAVDFCSLRYVQERSEVLSVRQNVKQPPQFEEDGGVMITVMDKGGMGYAAGADLSLSGLRNILRRAQEWAQHSQGALLFAPDQVVMPHSQGTYHSPVEKPWDSVSRREKLNMLYEESAQSRCDDRISDWRTFLWRIQEDSLYLSSDGAETVRGFDAIVPHISATAFSGHDSQHRSFEGYARQGGLEILEQTGFAGQGKQVAEEALQLLGAPNCPDECMDLLLAPSQMMLQIHESIGHPLELDRILGDERNYAGTSFVSMDMFGTYQYGSALLNVSFDPGVTGEFAGYAFDDEGLPAEKVYIIRNGILQRPLGGIFSQIRSKLPGTANSRASSWNRPPIDRMANLNVEAGDASFAEMLATVERGVYMHNNLSWSIDDSRNKFQFGCEWAQLIENGELTQVVKNPNYRGISANFWRHLKKVGNAETFDVLGVPCCGKGEPNQIIRVGHASPACLFSEVEVFGGMG